MSVFSDRLKRTRESKGWTKTYLARLLHMPLTTYANYEYGAREPDINTISRLAKVFNTSSDYLMGRTDDPVEPKDSKLDLDLKKNPHLLDMLSYNGQHLDDATKQMYIRLAKSQILSQKADNKKDE